MTTTYWSPTALSTAQVDTLTVAGVPAAGNTITAKVGITPNAASITYTLTGTDTAITAAAALQALLTASLDPRFQEIAFSVVSAVITCTANTLGTPFTLSSSATGGGATITHAVATPNVSPSDVSNAANWNRNGAASLPQNGDDVVVSDSSVPLLWNLDQLAAVQFASYTRWQTQTGQVGLPSINQSGYSEYRPTYFQFSGSGAGNLVLLLGQGVTGSGPSLERYNTGAQQTVVYLVASGTASDTYAVRFLGSNASNTIEVFSSSLAVALLPGETAQVALATVVGGGALTIGPGCAITAPGLLTANGSTLGLFCNTISNTVLAENNATVAVQATNPNYDLVQAIGGSTVTWLAGGAIATLVLQTGSVFDKSQDARALVIGASQQDGDTSTVRDPLSAITWSSPITFRNAVSAGPVQVGAGRQFQII